MENLKFKLVKWGAREKLEQVSVVGALTASTYCNNLANMEERYEYLEN